jgi:hypothetical protein
VIDWASRLGRPNLRTFTWSVTGGTGADIFAFEPSTGELRVAHPERLDENATYTVKARVSDGFNTSEEAEITVVTEDLANVTDGGAGGTVPATLALTLGSASFGSFVPGVARDYEASLAAGVTSTAGDATLSVVDPATASAGRLTNGAFSLAQPVHAAGAGAFAPVGAVPLTLQSWSGPVSNDAQTIRLKQPVSAAEPLRTGAYAKTFTFTLSTTAP